MSCSCDAAHALHLTAALTHCVLGICAESAGPQKRPVAGPRKGFTLSNAKLETITPIPYDILKVSRYLDCLPTHPFLLPHGFERCVAGSPILLDDGVCFTKGLTAPCSVLQEGLKN